jgi:GntR family transcriptional regulator / MocR family aminotransferase
LVAQTRANHDGFPADLLVALDRSKPRGLRRALTRDLRAAIQDGRLPAGTRLPPSRTLARELELSRNVVVEAYGQLVADGYLEARQGSGTRVRALQRRDEPPRGRDARPRPALRFLGGLPDPALFPRRAWERHYRAALSALPDPQLGYPGPQGARPLREALARYLGRVRGVVTEAENIVVTTGFTQALVLICRALRARGEARGLAVEDPCFGLHREAIAAAGLRPVPIPVDDDGLDVERLATEDVGAVLVAPAHSYPLGAVLAAERRAALARWAQHTGALVVEDDYDAEFRYDREPIGALQGLAPDRVVYGGCVSKTLTPALRLGWLAAPAWLVGDLVQQKALDDMGSPLLEQLALGSFVDDGAFAAHLRRVRPVYRDRRDAALDALAAALPDARPRGIAAGLHLYAELPHGCDEQALVDAARRRGVLVEGASWHWAAPADAPPALVLGYGSQGEAATRRGLAILRDAGAEAARSRAGR